MGYSIVLIDYGLVEEWSAAGTTNDVARTNHWATWADLPAYKYALTSDIRKFFKDLSDISTTVMVTDQYNLLQAVLSQALASLNTVIAWDVTSTNGLAVLNKTVFQITDLAARALC